MTKKRLKRIKSFSLKKKYSNDEQLMIDHAKKYFGLSKWFFKKSIEN